MFDLTGFFSRDDHHDEPTGTMAIDTPAAATAPVDHVVLKDGSPFAILNASPALAEFTLAGFVQATPEAQWTLARC